jgi:UDP-glucose 4-epimerase
VVKDPVQGLRDNVLATQNVLEGCVAAGVSRLVFASSAAVYGDPRILPTPEGAPLAPQSAYGWTKAAAEQLVMRCAEETSLSCTVLRLANCYGPGQEEKDEPGVVVAWLEALRAKAPLPLAQGPERTRDFTYVGDVVEAVITAMTAEDWGVFNVSTGIETGLTELAVLAAQSSGSAPQFEALRGQPGDIERSSLDPFLATRVLGWTAKTSVAEGVALTWDYLRAARPCLRYAAGNS